MQNENISEFAYSKALYESYLDINMVLHERSHILKNRYYHVTVPIQHTLVTCMTETIRISIFHM
jgi:hypothetical protein